MSLDGVAERVLTPRERKWLSPAAVIERLVGVQAHWPQAPYVGIWTRTTSSGEQRSAGSSREVHGPSKRVGL